MFNEKSRILILLIVSIFMGPALAQSSMELPKSESSLKASEFEMEEVNIQPDSTNSGRSYFGKFIEHEMDYKTISEQQSNNLSDLVDQVPGVDNVGGPRKESQKISIRGFQNNQILMLIDGTRQNFQMQHNSVIPVRNHLLRRMDIMKGGASSRFGNGALGGVVSFNTMQASDFLSSNESKPISVRSSYNSNSDAKQQSVTTGALFGEKGKAGILVDVTQTNTNNVQQSDGSELPFSAYRDQSVWAKGNFELGNGHKLSFTAEQMTKESTSPFNPQGGVFKPEDYADQIESYDNVRLQYKRESNSRYRPEFVIYNTETEMVRDRRVDSREDTRRTSTLGIGYHTTIDVIRDSQDWQLDLQPGFEVYGDQNVGERNDGDLSNFPNGRNEHRGYYVQGNLVYKERVWLQTGVRYDEVRLSGATLDQDRNANEVSPEAELGYRGDDWWAFSVSYEEGYNAPSIQQIFPTGIHYPVGFFETNDFVPNLSLAPEDSETVEAKLMFDWENASGENSGGLQISQYRGRIRNYIDQEVLSYTTQFVNRDLVEQEGTEIELSQGFGNFDFTTSFSRVRMRQMTIDQPLSQTPADQWATQLQYNTRRFSYGLQRLEFLEQDRVDRTGLANVTETPGFDLYNAFVARRVKISDYFGDLRLRANNILDKRHRRHGTPLLGPARDVRLELRLAL